MHERRLPTQNEVSGSINEKQSPEKRCGELEGDFVAIVTLRWSQAQAQARAFGGRTAAIGNCDAGPGTRLPDPSRYVNVHIVKRRPGWLRLPHQIALCGISTGGNVACNCEGLKIVLLAAVRQASSMTLPFDRGLDKCMWRWLFGRSLAGTSTPQSWTREAHPTSPPG